jgi:hypothetical protein
VAVFVVVVFVAVVVTFVVLFGHDYFGVKIYEQKQNKNLA